MATESTDVGAFYRADTIADAVALLREHDAVLIAGGQSLMPLLRQGLIDRNVIVDISGVNEHDEITVTEGDLVVGGLATHREVIESPEVSGSWRALSETAKAIGDRQVRNWGTVGGGVAHADPSLDYPPTLIAMDASVEYTDGETTHSVAIEDFYLGQYVTVLDDHEIVTGVRVPRMPDGSGVAFEKFAWRRGDMSLVNTAARVTVAEGTITNARLSVGAVASVPLRLVELEQRLEGSDAENESSRREVAARVSEYTDPVPESHASVTYKNRLVENLTEKALDRAVQRALEDG